MGTEDSTETASARRQAAAVVAAARRLRGRSSEIFDLPRTVRRSSWVKVGELRVSIAFDRSFHSDQQLIDVFDDRRKVFSAWTDPIEVVLFDRGQWFETLLAAAGAEFDAVEVNGCRPGVPRPTE